MRVNFEIPDEWDALVDDYAQQYGLNISQFMRKILAAKLNRTDTVRTGRPRKHQGGKVKNDGRGQQLNFRIPVELHEQFVAKCDSLGVTQVHVLEKFIERWVNT